MSFVKGTMDLKKGVTLTELLVAVTLISLIGAAAASINFSSRMGFIQAGKKARVSNEARLGMDHIVRHIRLANRVQKVWWFLFLWLDYDLNINTPLNTPADFTDDFMCLYVYFPWQKKIRCGFSGPGGGGWSWEDITNPRTAQGAGADITACAFNVQDGSADVPIVTVQITAVDKSIPPAPPQGTANNPVVTLTTKTALWCKGRN
ncbi:MAG: prepilin-type N-terminal cleavage/methylation domain-containing protein [Candidatus Omnitrophota bacterium]|nr:prepilin-type N-terminal cleavage/methylation domain-containing protein [Candidatus Omnitrophota bacterium]